MTGITKHVSLIVVAALAILFIAFVAPAPAQSKSDKDPSIGNQASSEPDEATAEEDEASLVPKGRHRAASNGGQTQQVTQDNATANAKRRVTNQLKKTQGSSQTISGSHNASVRSLTGTTSGISSHSTAKDLSKVKSLSIGSQTQGKPISLANQSPSGPSSIGGKPISVLSGGPGAPASGLIGAGTLKQTGLGGLGIKTGPIIGGTGIKTAPAPGGTTNTQGDVTGGGKGSVTTGGVQSGGGAGSNTQGSTVSTGGGNTVGGIQQSGTGNTVDVNQTTNNVTNVTKVSGGGGGGFGGGGVSGEIPSVDVSPIEPVAEPVVVTRVVPAAPSDSCPTVVELNQMGFSYYQTGTYTSAEDAFKRALVILDTQACKNVPLKATTLENLAFTFDKLGKHDDATKYQEQAQLLRRMQ
jgi:hypothetical protein